MWTEEQELNGLILKQAKEDLYLHPNAVENSLYFFLCKDICDGSFLYICETLSYNPEAVLRTLQERIDYCIRFKNKSRAVVRQKKVKTIDYINMFSKPEEE